MQRTVNNSQKSEYLPTFYPEKPPNAVQGGWGLQFKISAEKELLAEKELR
jgi:hypothetical protein